jgi:hypothetical protein
MRTRASRDTSPRYATQLRIMQPEQSTSATERAWTRCRTAHLYGQGRRRRLPLSERVIAPTQRQRRPPVLDWASSASPREDMRALMRTACSRNWPTSVSVARALPWSPAHWMRFAKLSSTERLRSAFTLPTKLLPVQRSPRLHHTSQQVMTPRPAKLQPMDAKQQQRRQQPPAHHHLSQNRPTRHDHRPKYDGVARRADSCSPTPSFMRHRVRRRWREWERICASGQVLSWIRHGVRVKFKHGTRPKPFNHGIYMLDATPAQLEFLNSELPRFEACGAWERSDNPRYVSRMFLVPKPA